MPHKNRILLIDDEEGMCRMMEAVLTDSGYGVEYNTRSYEAVDSFRPGQFDLVVTDIKMPGMDGLEVLQRLKEKDPQLPVIIISAYATVETAIQALRRGAHDMVTKPFEPEELIYRVKNALKHNQLIKENTELREELQGRFDFGRIVGSSPQLQKVLEMVKKLAIRDTSVLITGESGTGKELVAQAIHYNSQRRDRKYLAINCGALPESVLESELFGYKKGAFTGANENRKGLLEEADGGTLFLDEVGNLPLNVQKTLLRFLQEQEFRRIGDNASIKVNVRIISATNADLEKGCKTGEFREDLFYRLNVVNIHMPPLRERRDDILLLAAHFIREQNQQFGTQVKGFTPEASKAIHEYFWPGNIRQLKNVIEACMAMESGVYLTLPVLSQFIDLDGDRNDAEPQLHAGFGSDIMDYDYSNSLARFERDYLKRLLKDSQGNVEAAAKASGMNMATIYRKMKKYGVDKADF
ncbi:MAG: sigma-54 dependent transcriptional regulator [Syntrophotaleaceae bacterium]